MSALPGLLLRLVLLLLAALPMSVIPGLMPGTVDLVLVVIASMALPRGAWAGALIGLGGGWLIDVIPPGAEPLGSSALLYCAVGALLGATRRYVVTSPTALPVLPLLSILGASLLVLSVRAVTAAAGVGSVHLSELAWTWLFTAVAATLLLTPLVRIDRWLAVHRWG